MLSRVARRIAAAGLALVIWMSSAVHAASVSLGSIGVQYSENFDTLVTSGSSSTLPAGWALLESGTGADSIYTAGTGSKPAGDTYSFGTSSISTERALGILRDANVVSMIGASFTNNTGATITSLDIAYNGEQWRCGANRSTAKDRLDFQISTDATSLGTGTYNDYDLLDFIGPISNGVATLNGNLSANRVAVSSSITGLSIPSGSTFFIRWSDFDVAGTAADDGLAVDDFRLTHNGALTAPAPLPAPASNWGIAAAMFALALVRIFRTRIVKVG